LGSGLCFLWPACRTIRRPARLGLEVVVEDYVHSRWLEVLIKTLLSLAMALAMALAALAIFSIIYLVRGA